MNRPLTANEQAVLHGLVSRPTLNDRELSEVLGIKVSTVTAIRRRLRRADYFVTRRIPMMHRLGWELLVAGVCRLRLAREADAAKRMHEALGTKYPTIFHVVQAPDHFVFLAAAPDYTTFSKDYDDFRMSVESVGLADGMSIQTAVFPLARTYLVTYFDFSRILAQAFGFEDEQPVHMRHEKVGDLELTRKEADVLKGLVRFPELSDKAVAAKIKASRQAVSKMRRSFHEDGLLRSVRIPNVRALGFELLGAALMRHAPVANVKVRTEAVETVARSAPVFLYLASNSESVFLGALRTYEEGAHLRASLGQFTERRGLPAPTYESTLSPANLTEMPRNCDFTSIVQML